MDVGKLRNDDLFYNLTVNKKSATIIADAERELLKLSALCPFGLSKRQANRTKKKKENRVLRNRQDGCYEVPSKVCSAFSSSVEQKLARTNGKKN